MVAKIMKSTGSMKSPLDYNEHKVDEGNAQVVAMANMDDSLDPVHDTFSRYERGNIRSKEVSFHMSVNPGPEEHLSDEQIRAFVGELMEGLGYGNQPFVIYRHNDIDREHYHVVSIRVDGDGKKVKDFLENRNCLKLMGELSEKYGIAVGNAEVEKETLVRVNPERFIPDAGNIVRQMDAVSKECCSYRMTSMDQFRLVMKNHGLEVLESPDRGGNMILKGLDMEGKSCTRPVSSALLSFDLPETCRGRIRECLDASRVPEEDLNRISKAVAVCIAGSRSEAQFTGVLSQVGIGWECTRDGRGKMTGAVFVDNVTRSVFNVSELKHVGLRTLQKADAHGWDGSQLGEDVQKAPDFSKDVAKGLSMLESLLSSMTGGGSQEHDMKDTPKKHKGRRR